MIPPDAAEKAAEAAKTRDYYADLTDEERAEEGLPPREPAKAETAPGEKPPEEEPEEGEPEEEPEEESVEDEDSATERLFEEIANLQESVDDALGRTKPARTEGEVDARLKAALESDDESTRFLAEELIAAKQRLERVELDARTERVDRQRTKDDTDFRNLQKGYTVGGKPMTKAQVEMVEDYIDANKEVGSRLDIEDVARVVFKDALGRVNPKSSPGKAPGGSVNGKGSPVATIVDEGSAGGVTVGPWKPRPNETMESAVDAAGAALLGVKR